MLSLLIAPPPLTGPHSGSGFANRRRSLTEIIAFSNHHAGEMRFFLDVAESELFLQLLVRFPSGCGVYGNCRRDCPTRRSRFRFIQFQFVIQLIQLQEEEEEEEEEGQEVEQEVQDVQEVQEVREGKEGQES